MPAMQCQRAKRLDWTLLLCLVLSTSPIHAADLDEVSSTTDADRAAPLWELGAGVAGATFPAYPGSDEQRSYGAPFPYVIYRAEFLRADEDGVRGRFFWTDRLQLELSGGGTPPVRSKDVPVRAGMPDLGLSVELGPALRLELFDSERDRLSMSLNLRALFEVELPDIAQRGLIVQPEVHWERRLTPQINAGTTLYARIADRGYHEHFYGVGAAFATDARPAFRGTGGYNGSGLAVFADIRPGADWRLRFGVDYRSLHDTAFADSPLVRRDHRLSIYLAVARVFFRSATMVPLAGAASASGANSEKTSDAVAAPQQ